MQAVIEIEEGVAVGRRTWIERGQQFSVGNSWLADMDLDTPDLLPMHMIFSIPDNRCAVHGLNGAQINVNGRVCSSFWLNDRDAVRAGEMLFRIRLNGFETASQPALRRPVKSQVHVPSGVQVTNENLVRELAHDGDFRKFLPASDLIHATEIVQNLSAKNKLWGYCRFDRWEFPMPEELVATHSPGNKCGGKNADQYLPVLFPLSSVGDPASLVSSGLDSGRLMVLSSGEPVEELNSFLRDSASQFLSPMALGSMLDHCQNGATAGLLGPFDGVLLGSNSNWQYFGRNNVATDD